jgi:dienelactone hydrolase
MQTQDIDYRADAVMRGYLAFDEARAGRRPGVLVFHEGLGLGEFAMARARRLAELGYVALAADMFGDRRNARNLTEVAKLVGELRAAPETLRGRSRAALAALAAMPQVDPGRLAAIGFCFGGPVVLELARDGADLKAAVSFHGVLTTSAPAVPGGVKASVLVLTGARRSAGAAGAGCRIRGRDARGRGAGLAADRLRQYAAWFHQSGRRRLDAAHRAL